MGKWTVIIKHVEEEDKDKILDEIANLENENEIFCPGGGHVESHPEPVSQPSQKTEFVSIKRSELVLARVAFGMLLVSNILLAFMAIL